MGIEYEIIMLQRVAFTKQDSPAGNHDAYLQDQENRDLKKATNAIINIMNKFIKTDSI
jgi:hypothetical protein